MYNCLNTVTFSVNLAALAALLLSLPTGLTIAYFCTRRGYANYENEIGGKHYKLRHFFKELFWRYPTKRYGLRYKDRDDEDKENDESDK